MGLRVVFVMRMINETDVIQENVQIKIGAKTENALWRRTFLIAMNVPKNVKRDFCLKLNLMASLYLLSAMVLMY